MTLELITPLIGDLDLSGPRAAAFQRIATVDGSTEDWDAQLSALTLAFVDTLLAGDTQTLEYIADPLRDRLATFYGPEVEEGHGREVRGWFMSLLSLCRWGLQRLPAPQELQYQPGTQPYDFLMLLAKTRTTSSSAIKEQLNTGDSQVSRTGRDLASSGLVVQRRAGRQALWELTPRGRQVVERLEHDGRTHSQRQVATADSRKPDRRRGSHGHSAKQSTSGTPQVAQPSSRALSAFKGEIGPVRHVVPSEGRWAVKANPHDARAKVTADTKKEAVARAREQLVKTGGTLFEHRKDGTVSSPRHVRAKR